MQLKEKKAKRKVNKVNIAAIIVSIIALLGLLVLCVGIGAIAFLLKDKPNLNLSDFNSQESTIVYDKDNNQIYELGTVIRQNIEYEDLPNSLVDAFVAVEDSRFFEHGGFDIPRFAKAFLSNLKTMSFSQGGSTFTMQLVKNTYFVNDESGQGAAKSIKRKVQEIALAMQLERETIKKDIFINYLNKLNFGGTNQNIRGVQKAAQYYFGKNVNDLNLEESAMLAGVVNSPYLFNPFNYLEYAQERRDEVLYLMKYHGYISDNEYQLALATRVEDFLVDSTSSKRGSGQGTPYQAYIDYVVEEVYNLTGLDPYTTPMRIKTCMDADIQTLMDNIQAGIVDDLFEYPDDEFEVASICVNNGTGEIVGILGGRNYADGGALLLNHATDQYKQPGSSIKPILDYAQAFEVLGWSTSHCLIDKPITYQGTDYIISNSSNTYDGEMTLKEAVGRSLNTPAIQTIRQLIDAKGNPYLVDYLTSMGFDIDLTDFDEQYGIGGKGLNVSCLQMAGAYAAIMNGGYYTKPHAITKVEFLNEKAPIIPTYQKTQTISEQACFLTTELLKNNVEGGYANLMGSFKNDNYTVYAKTGTSNWGSEGAQYNIPNGSIKDGWVVACTSEYSVATWMGYEKGQLGKPSYMNYDLYNKNIKGKISKLILQKCGEKFGYPDDISKPSGVNKITHIKKVGVPYVAPIDGMDEQYITSGYIMDNSKYSKLVSAQAATVEDLTKEPTVSIAGTTLKIEWPEYPDESMLKKADDSINISLLKSDGTVLLGATGRKLFDYTWVFGPVKYKADITVIDANGKEVDKKKITSDDKTISVDLSGELGSGYKVDVYAYYGFENLDINSKGKTASTKIEGKLIALPNSKNVSYIEDILKEYTSDITFEKEMTDDNQLIGQVYKVEINGKQVNLSDEPTIDSLKIKSAKIYYYIDIKYTVTLSKTVNDSSITFAASVTPANKYDDDFTWYVNGELSNETSSQLTIDVDGETTVEVRLKDGTSDSITVSPN